MEEEFVTYKEKKYFVKNWKLDLSSIEINHISEIKGLERLTHLESLSLISNKIKEITGLENLTNLQTLRLRYNKIEELKGLEFFPLQKRGLSVLQYSLIKLGGTHNFITRR